MTLRQYADKIVEKLRGQGFIIQRYDAYSTYSVYLKLDYGVCNTIRISDHPGKEHLHYRYNLLLDGENNIVDDDGYMRYYYNKDTVKDMLMQILFDRQDKLQRYGKERYRDFMIKNMTEHKSDKGFWHDAKLVTDDINTLDNIISSVTPENCEPPKQYGNRATCAFVDEDAFAYVPPTKVDNDVYASGPRFALELLKKSIAEQHQLDNVARFKPGDKVKVTVSFRELVDFFMTYDETDGQAQTHALQILGRPEYNIGTNLGATQCDEGIFYTIEFPLIPMELLPGDFLDRV